MIALMKKTFLIAGLLLSPATLIRAESYDSLEQALKSPAVVTALSLNEHDRALKHLPPELGSMINLQELSIACLEELEGLPAEVGNLRKLEKLIIDNANGCGMNVSIPESIGNLTNLKVLRLYGALDGRGEGGKLRIKELPRNISNLRGLEELDLGRNGLTSFPSQLSLSSMSKLRKINLSFNDIHELPDSLGTLNDLVELDVSGNGGVALPKSLANTNGVRIRMGNNYLKLRDQERLRNMFPRANFEFENEFDDGAANEESVSVGVGHE